MTYRKLGSSRLMVPWLMVPWLMVSPLALGTMTFGGEVVFADVGDTQVEGARLSDADKVLPGGEGD